jgi:UDPglucose 6-dehydrogenase
VNICVIGAGYVGLVTAAVLADLGNEVICLDTDEGKVAALRAGVMPIFEPGLEEMVKRNRADGRLSFTADYPEAIPGAEVVFVAVSTPPLPDGHADLSFLAAAVEFTARHLAGETLIVVKSTVPVGCGDFVRELLERHAPAGARFEVASNPEFLREGSAIADSLRPDRIVIGCGCQEGAMKLVELYAPLERPMLLMDVKSAELVKHASNSFLATRISFINGIADLCERAGADIQQVIKGMGADARIGRDFLSPGLGYGGSCFPKDTEALASTCAALDCRFELLEAVIAANRRRVPAFVARLERVLGELRGKTLAVLGLAFKPNTDDLRESRAMELTRALLAAGATVRAYDPVAMEGARRLLPEVTYCDSPYEAAEGAAALLIATEWNEFKQLNLERIREALQQPLILDSRSLYAPQKMKALGFRYLTVGRKDD